MAEAKKQYEKRKAYYQRRAAKLNRSISRISNIRLTLFLAGCGLAAYFYLAYRASVGHVVLAFTAVCFTALVLWHQALKTKLRYLEVLGETYDQALRRLTGEWKSFPDTGKEFRGQAHPYVDDLDLFGPSSLFQWLSTARTFRGREKLKDWFTEFPEDVGLIQKRQEAVKELAPKLAWRHRFLTEAELKKLSLGSPARIIEWAKTYNPTYLRPVVIVAARALPLVTLAFIALHFLTDKIALGYPLIGFLLQVFILFAGKQRGITLDAVYAYKDSIGVYEKMLERFEKRTFRAEYLRDLQQKLSDREGKAAFRQIKRLSVLAERIANRSNAMFLIINIFTLWDVQCMIALEAWKEKSGRFLERWLDTVAELEGLASLAMLHLDRPDWTMPEFAPEDSGIWAAGIGHPLLAEPICNDVVMNENSGILLITGSNMSGKSTLLRTVGINLVLAYAGAPVCARSFRCSLLRIYSCMRVSDNLSESVSSFYAELLRIKMIVGATKRENKVFFLLDEIFKGTNSEDRHAGAKILIKQLGQAGAMGMVSTHDLELGDLERESKQKIKNYHFREYYKNDEICFDYKLRPGISTTRNAMYLIKLAGIDVEGE